MRQFFCASWGICTGVILIYLDSIIPEGYMNFIGNAVAGSELVGTIKSFFSSQTSAHKFHVWLIAISISFIPIAILSVSGAIVSRLFNGMRALVYSVMFVALAYTAFAKFLYTLFNNVDSDFALSFSNIASNNLSVYFANVALYIVAPAKPENSKHVN